jgi:CDP-glucose 4,6-dehydratase
MDPGELTPRSGAGWSEAFAGRRVLVSGHTGFKGSWLGLWLRELGADVGGLALDPDIHQRHLYEAHGGHDALAYERIGDIRHLEVCEETVRDFAPDLILHLAAQPLVRASYDAPVMTFGTNVMGTVNILDAARRHGDLAGVVVVTTDKCYENREQIWPYRETDAVGGHDPYSASKGAAEIATSSYARSYFDTPSSAIVATARAGNVIGGGDQSTHRLVPDLVRAIVDGNPLTVRSPNSVRPWQHVLEPLAGYLELGARMLLGETDVAGSWNFGPYPHEAETVAGMLGHANAILGERFPVVRVDETGGPHEASLLILDVTKAMRHLTWRPSYDNTERMAETLEWYLADIDGSCDLAELAKQQIARTMARLAAA